jgi:hypothetical protein
LVQQYFRIPSAPPEREPSPESFQPSIAAGNWKARTLLMFTMPVRCQAGWAARSRAATASTSTDVATGTRPTTFPVAGQVTTTSWGTSAFGGFVGAAVSVLIAITSAE